MTSWNFVQQFTGYVRSRTDAPPDFHIHAALATLSVALGNGVYIEGRGKNLYPNLWIVIIGRSGIGKSVPLDISQRVLEKAGLGEHRLDDSFTQEALYDLFQKQVNRIAYLQEFASFMGMLNKEYNAGLRDWLTDMYDCPPIFRRQLRQGTPIELHHPFLTILGATAPDWFSEQFKMHALKMGFLTRFIYCPAGERGAYVEDPGGFNEEIEKKLGAHLREISTKLGGRADFSAVRHQFNTWDRAQREALEFADPDLAGILSRGPAKVQKAAVLFRAARRPIGLDVQAEDMERAIQYVERSDRLALDFLTTAVPHNDDDAQRMKIVERVVRAGGSMAWSTAMKNTHLDKARFQRAIDTLVATDEIRVVSTANGGRDIQVAGGSQRFADVSQPIRILRNSSQGGP